MTKFADIVKKIMDISILQKIKSWCASQERCTSEVREKLIKSGVEPENVNLIIDNLSQENFINDHRYAGFYAGSKFRIHRWGKEKIRYELEQKEIDTEVIETAMEEISQEEYLRTITLLIEKEMGKSSPEKILQKLCSKGYEEEVVREMIENLGI